MIKAWMEIGARVWGALNDALKSLHFFFFFLWKQMILGF